MPLSLLLAAGIAAALPADRASASHAAARDTTIPFTGDLVEVDGGTGTLRIRRGADGAVRLRTDAADDDTRDRYDVVRTGRVLRIRVTRGRRGADDLDLAVPAGTGLRLRTQSGDVTVDAVNGDLFADTFSGDVVVRGARRAEIASLSGAVTVTNVRDGVEVRTTSGAVTLRDVGGAVRVDGTSGDVSIAGGDAALVEVAVMNGDIRYDGRIADGGRYVFRSHSGDVRLALPRDARAMLEVASFDGDVVADGFPLLLLPDLDADDRRATDARRAVERARDSVRRAVRDSVRRDRERDGRRRGEDTGDLGRTISEAIAEALTAVSESFERDIAPAISQALAEAGRDLRSGTRPRRFRLGEEGGPLVTVSTFSGDVVLSPRP